MSGVGGGEDFDSKLIMQANNRFLRRGDLSFSPNLSSPCPRVLFRNDLAILEIAHIANGNGSQGLRKPSEGGGL